MATAEFAAKFLRSPQTYFEADLPAYAAALDYGKVPAIGKIPQHHCCDFPYQLKLLVLFLCQGLKASRQ
jgi:hypothetical protein